MRNSLLVRRAGTRVRRLAQEPRRLPASAFEGSQYATSQSRGCRPEPVAARTPYPGRARRHSRARRAAEPLVLPLGIRWGRSGSPKALRLWLRARGGDFAVNPPRCPHSSKGDQGQSNADPAQLQLHSAHTQNRSRQTSTKNGTINTKILASTS